MSKVDMIVDLQYGSTGKGLIAGYLAMKNGYDTIINANMPNAGHTFIDKHEQKMIFKVLPNGVVSPNCKTVMIGPGSVFSMDRLREEIKIARNFGYMQNTTVYIHPNAVPLRDHHKNKEQEGTLSSIGSTQQGSAAAMIQKINRSPEDVVIAKDSIIMFHEVLGVAISIATQDLWRKLLLLADDILAEGAQGFSLGIDEMFYPFCTSRNCTPARFMSDMGIPLSYLRTVIGTARTYPIRVGGTSGGCYDDQDETTWEELGLSKEYTTVTKRERRVFTFSHSQIQDAMFAMEPDKVFLNFCNYVTAKHLQEMIPSFGTKLKYLGFGPAVGDINEI